MIKFGTPWIESNSRDSVLKNNIEIDGVKNTIWFKVDKEFEPFLCSERNDAYLIAVLNYAMRNRHDIELEAPVSGELLFNIETYLVPALIENNPHFFKPNIKAKITFDQLPNAGAVGTGISCGVDSLHALATKTDSKYKNLNITHLTFNNVGSHGEGEQAQKLYKSRINRPRQFAEENGFKFVWSDSNLMDVIRQSHFKTHTYSSMFPVFCLQKLYSVYFYASAGHRFSEFNLTDCPQASCASYEILSLQVFSTRQLRIYSEGMGLTRLKKLHEIINYEPSYSYLNVCLSKGDNCNVCEKCVRTLLELDILKALDRYSKVFNIGYYKNNRNWYLKQLLYQKAYGKHDYFEIYARIKNSIPISVRIQTLPKISFIKLANALRKNRFIYSLVKRIKDK